MEYFKLVTQYGNFAGRVVVLNDDYETAKAKAIDKAKNRVNPFTDIIIYHVIEDKHTENATEVVSVKGKN